MEKDADLDCAGFYMLSGFPCEVRTLEDGYGYEGFMYMPGEGLIPYDVTKIIFEGNPISESTFKDYIIELTKMRSGA